MIVQAKHKIQSAGGPLDMRLNQVPKMLSVLRKEWAPSAFCISFKVSSLNKRNFGVASALSKDVCLVSRVDRASENDAPTHPTHHCKL